jgi:ribosome biogenesis GTPase
LVYISKLDLLSGDQLATFDRVKSDYEAIGYLLFFELSALTEHLSGRTTVFIGQTGAGKTTLLNKIAPEMALPTGETSEKLGRGRHTTRHVELHEAVGGLIADTPGFSSLDYEINNVPDLNRAFRDISAISGACKFRECSHTHEPSCAVKEAVSSGMILQSRYDNYLQLLSEINHTREVYVKRHKKEPS